MIQQIPLLGIYMKEMKSVSRRDICTPHVHCSIIHNSQDMKTTQVSVDEWMDKEDVLYIYTMEYYSTLRKKEILPFVTTWMDLDDNMLSEISQAQKDKFCMMSLICGLRKKKSATS